MVRRPLETDETKGSRRRRRTRLHKSKKGEERKSTGSINCEFWCEERVRLALLL